MASTSSLTDRQRVSLNSSILEYLKVNGYENAFAAFQSEVGDSVPVGTSKMLERKWTAVVRLTKTVHDLKKQLEEKEDALKEALPFVKSADVFHAVKFGDTLPNEEKCHLRGHRKAINQVRFHPNTPWIATASDDGMVGIWDFEENEGKGKLVKWLKGHKESVQSVSFNKNGTILASASNDTTIRLWNLEDDFRSMRTLSGHDNSVSHVIWQTNDTILSCSRDGTLRLWEDVLTSGARNTRIVVAHSGEWIKNMDLSLDGSLLATCSVDQSICIFDAKSLELQCTLKNGHSHVIESVTFSNISADEMIVGRVLKDDLDDSPSLKPRFLASCSRDKTVILWDLQAETVLTTLTGHSSWVRDVLFHPCGKYLLSCADDKSVKVWDLKHKREETCISDAHKTFVSSLDWNAALELLATGSNGRDLKVWYKSRRITGTTGEPSILSHMTSSSTDTTTTLLSSSSSTHEL